MIRSAIKKELQERNISIRKCALDLGFRYQDFYRFLKNERPYPVEKIEKCLQYLSLEIAKKI